MLYSPKTKRNIQIVPVVPEISTTKPKTIIAVITITQYIIISILTNESSKEMEFAYPKTCSILIISVSFHTFTLRSTHNKLLATQHTRIAAKE